ncbi:hypothetical protein J6590_042348 [Homalodisca vitripennis]|nr:hypothetical protein J6590_042348 [Homalodisca vitripennis]
MYFREVMFVLYHSIPIGDCSAHLTCVMFTSGNPNTRVVSVRVRAGRESGVAIFRGHDTLDRV